MTFVAGRRARPVNTTSFLAFTDAPVVAILPNGVDFDGDLTPEQSTAVWEWMTSRDDDDQADRATLRASDGASNLPEMVRAYVLGDPLPEPVYDSPA